MSIEFTETLQTSKSDQNSKPQFRSEFAADVAKGLSHRNKYLPSKYLYNQRGDELFQQIMSMPEYYVTRAEHEIFFKHKGRILEEMRGGKGAFQLLEFGAGDGLKTKTLLEYFVSQKADFSYFPIDISANILSELTTDLKMSLPELQVNGICDDYFDAFHRLDKSTEDTRKVVLFLGANIGNFTSEEASSFLHCVAGHLSSGDRLMIGFDLKKDPSVILDAYFDKAGITAAFELNLLNRINEELGGNFDLDSFKYFPIYEPQEGSIRSYLVSQKAQDVEIEALETTVHFDAWETIYTERSQKFSLEDIEQLARTSGFRILENFFDSRRYFTNSLWELR